MSKPSTPAKPSASVILMRHSKKTGVEILLLRKNPNIHFGNTWVFPGGVSEAQDGSTQCDAVLEIAQRTALRETFEETGITLHTRSLLPFSHWLTPESQAKRYSTHFFLYPLRDTNCKVCIDNSEIVEAQWANAADVIQEQTLPLSPPTFVNLHRIALISSLTAVQQLNKAQGFTPFHPKTLPFAHGILFLYQEDFAYADPYKANQRIDDKPKHRLIAYHHKKWQYIHDLI